MKLYPFPGSTTAPVLLASQVVDPALHVTTRIQAAEELALLVMVTFDGVDDANRKQID